MFNSSIDDADEDDDQIELNENIFKNKKTFINKREDQTVKKLLQQPETEFNQSRTAASNSTRKKELSANFEKFNKQFKMSIIKGVGFVLAIVVAVLVTFFITHYTSKCKTPDNKPIPDGAPTKNMSKAIRLPTNVWPLNYDIKLQTYLRPDQLSFNGSVSITVACRKSTKKIQLNANELEIKEQQVKVLDGNKALRIKKFTYENEVITLDLDDNLRENQNYSINIIFRGKLTSGLSGFYRSSYTNSESGQTTYFAMTQFQATDARRAFPCFDGNRIQIIFYNFKFN